MPYQLAVISLFGGLGLHHKIAFRRFGLQPYCQEPCLALAVDLTLFLSTIRRLLRFARDDVGVGGSLVISNTLTHSSISSIRASRRAHHFIPALSAL
jgi:hypothetical protein